MTVDKTPIGAAPSTTRTRVGAHIRARTRRRNAVLTWLLVIAIYLVLGMVANLPSWLHGATHHLQNQGADLPEEVWFLAVTPYSLLHGHNPFFTNYINVPYGANLMANATMLLPGLLVAPVTFIWGPVAAFNVLMVICYAGSATAAYALFRRWVASKPAAFAGGLLYGFSPYMVAVGYGHLFLLFAVFPPLILLVLDVIVVRQPGHPLRWGFLLGLLAIGQLFTSSEVLASSATLTIAGLVVLALFRRKEIRSRFRYAALSLSSGLATFAVLSAYPIWMLIFGPQHLHGPTQLVSSLNMYSSDVVGLVAPTVNQLISPAFVRHVADGFTGGNLSENGTYLGIPLILVLVAFVWRYRRLGIVQFAAVMALVALIFSFGPRLRVDNRVIDVRLPFVVFRHLPLLVSAIASRYAVYVALFCALILAIGLDRLSQVRVGALGNYRIAGVTGTAIAVFALFPLIPNWPYQIANVTVPSFFASKAVRSVPEGSVLLSYPMAEPSSNGAMLWQAEDGFRYRIPAGYVLTPGPGDTVTGVGPPSTTGALFQAALVGTKFSVPPSAATICDVDNDLRIWRVDTIVVTDIGADPAEVVALVDSALGVSPRRVDGVFVYFDVPPAEGLTMARLACRPTSVLP